MFFGLKSNEKINTFNIGSIDQIKVRKIAQIVCAEMGLKPRFKFTGGKGGWTGDVPQMLLSINKMKSLGWIPRCNSEQAVKKTVGYILKKS